MVTFYTNSTTYLPIDIVREQNISIIQNRLKISDEIFKENEISNKSALSKLEEQNTLAETYISASVEEIYTAFKMAASMGHDIIGAFESDTLSKSLQNAMEAQKMIKRDYPNIKVEIIDSKAADHLVGLIILEGVDARNEGLDFYTIVGKMNEARDKIVMHYILGTTKYIHKSTFLFKMICRSLEKSDSNIIVAMKNAEKYEVKTVKSRQEGMEALIDRFKKVKEDNFIKYILIGYIGDKSDAESLANALKVMTFADVFVAESGPINACRNGDGTLLASWLVV